MRRRLVIFGILVAVVALIVGGTFYLGAHRAPTCSDNKQNQGEAGVDCGGPCSYLCSETEAAPAVRFVRAISPAPGRTDVIAYIDNPNTGVAAHDVPYSIELYGPTNVLIAKRDGTVDLPPSSTIAVYVPNLFSGSETVAHVFLTFHAPQHMWYPYPGGPAAPTTRDVQYTEAPTPRITATAVNSSAQPFNTIVFVIAVFDANGEVIAASQTLASVPPEGTAPLTFTWNAPFSAAVGKIEITPIVPLTTFP